MKYHYSLLITLFLCFSFAWGQNTGDIAFVAFNADGDDDFAVVALADIPANTTIYFSDNELNGSGGFVDLNEGIQEWNTGGSVILAGTVVTFSNTVSSSRTASIGTLSVNTGSMNLSGAGDALFAYLGTSGSMPTTFLAGIQNEAGNFGNLTGSGLTEGSTFINFYTSGSPDGGIYNGINFGQTNFSDFLTALNNTSNWITATSNGEDILDSVTGIISMDNFSAINLVWNGSANDNDWTNASNWTPATSPSTTSDISIPNGLASYPTISSPTTVIAITIDSGASLIATAAVTGNVTYDRNLGTTNWYLVSSPVNGEDMTDMRTNNSFNTNASNEISFAPYDNSQATPNDRWAYFANTATDALVNGKGYSTSLSTAGNISFTGTINNGDVPIALTQGGGSGNNFNLIGNPYTSFVNSGTFLTNESADLMSETIWVWNQNTSNYETKVTVDAFKIAPGQGFFVEANSTNNVTFLGNATMQSHESTDTFQRNGRTEIQLNANDGTNDRFAKIYYINGTSTGFDNGYDGELFSGVSNSFAIYTELLSNNEGKNFQIQSLPNSDIETMIIPVGLIADTGKEITLSVASSNLPTGVEVYLEDRINNTFVNLSEGSHKIKTTSATSGTGQYYLHTTAKRLSNEDIVNNFKNVSIYKSASQELTVTGLQGKASIKVFSILGKEVNNTVINSNGNSKINIPNLSSGVYIVKLSSDLGKLTKKIILE